MIGRTFILIAVLGGAASALAQQQATQRTPWHVSTVFTYKHESDLGRSNSTGTGIATVPSGYNAVIEHLSARCVASAALVIVYGEIAVSANPSNPGQSGKPGPAGQEDTANHPILFQTAYSGGVNVYVASQRVKLRLIAPIGAQASVRFLGGFINQESASDVITCLFSLSGYLEKP
jgi:hypothetical protein